MSEKIQKLDSVLQNVLKSSPLAAGLEEQRVLSEWSNIVGPEIAKHTRAIAINDGTLFVQVESSVWSQELTMLKSNICRELNRKLGSRSVHDVRFRSGESP